MIKTPHKQKLFILISILLISITIDLSLNKAHADFKCRDSCKCEVTCKPKLIECSEEACECQSSKDTPVTTQHITDEFIQHRKWIVKSVWEAHVLPAMMLMTEQISAVAMQQMFAVGTLFDAKHQLETQRILQTMKAQAHKDYHPSKGMCEFGTNTRSLAASDRNADLTQVSLAKRMLDRVLLSGDGISGGGPRDDIRSRLANFKTNYCNAADYGNGMGNLCDVENPARLNKDLDFTKTIDQQQTLEVDFSQPNATADETDVIALATNLYGQDLFPYVRGDKLALPDGRLIRNGAFAYMDVRALHAKRSVAQAAYAAQAAMRSAGTDDVQPYLQAILEEMGIAEEIATEMIGDRPSYHAQMELLTKTLYQTPNFYTDLYDKPANIDRKIVSMQALGLMQRRDVYRSALRREAIEAVWLEGELETLEDIANNRIRETLSDNKVLDLEGLD